VVDHPSGGASRGTILLFEALRFAAFAARTWPGLDAGALLLRLGLVGGEPADPERRVPIEQVFALLAEVTRAVGDPAVPVRFAAARRVEDSGVLGYAAMTAPSARAAFQRVARYQRLISDSGAWRIDDAGPPGGHPGRGARVRVAWVRPGARSLGHRLANETVLAEMVAGARQVLGDVAPVEVGFRHPAPPHWDAHRRFFAAPIAWGSTEDYLDLPAELLDRRPLAANEALEESFLREAERRLAEEAPVTLVGRVRAEMEAAMVAGSVDARGVARRLGMSERSLRRALAGEGTSFREALDAVRRDRATELLGQGSSSVTDVAFLLGFSEASAFTRAFRRWFGMSPTEGRAVARARLRTEPLPP
jgi:AraC-like DNA-binding protein